MCRQTPSLYLAGRVWASRRRVATTRMAVSNRLRRADNQGRGLRAERTLGFCGQCGFDSSCDANCISRDRLCHKSSVALNECSEGISLLLSCLVLPPLDRLTSASWLFQCFQQFLCLSHQCPLEGKQMEGTPPRRLLMRVASQRCAPAI